MVIVMDASLAAGWCLPDEEAIFGMERAILPACLKKLKVGKTSRVRVSP